VYCNIEQIHSARQQPTATVHKAQLANLSKTDPEFYHFLQEQDQELLQFSDVSSQSDDIDDLSQSDQSIVPVIDNDQA